MATEIDAVARPAELLERARGGDADAFAELAAAAETRLFRQALALCGEVALAEDLVAETMIGAWQGLGRFAGTCRFSTWLHAILLHRFQKHVRRVRTRPLPATRLGAGDLEAAGARLDTLSDGQPTAAEQLVRDEAATQLRAALANLPEAHRTVLALRFFEEASLAEIAAALELPLGTVKSRLHHGLEKLREMPEAMNLRNDGRDT